MIYYEGYFLIFDCEWVKSKYISVGRILQIKVTETSLLSPSKELNMKQNFSAGETDHFTN